MTNFIKLKVSQKSYTWIEVAIKMHVTTVCMHASVWPKGVSRMCDHFWNVGTSMRRTSHGDTWITQKANSSGTTINHGGGKM